MSSTTTSSIIFNLDVVFQVVKLWTLWAAPWRQVNDTNAYSKDTQLLTVDGWAYFVLDNALYYIPLVEIILQRTATFTFAENQTTFPTLPARPTTALHTTSKNISPTASNAQLQILFELFNVLNTDGITSFLAEVEECLSSLQARAAGGIAMVKNERSSRQAIESVSNKYFHRNEEIISKKLNQILDQLLQLGGGSWKSPHLYTEKLVPRAEPLIKTFEALQQASQSKPDAIRSRGPSIYGLGGKPRAEHIKEIQKAADLLKATFSVSDVCYCQTGDYDTKLFYFHFPDYNNSKTKAFNGRLYFLCSAKIKVQNWW